MKKEKKKNTQGFFPMLKTLSMSVREYKKASILTPIFVTFEVILECFIPYLMTILLGIIKIISGTAEGYDPVSMAILKFLTGGNIESANMLTIIIEFGVTLVLIAMLSLFFGAMSGKYCAKASSGFAKNLRKDLFYKVQDFSFHNIDKFSTSGLVTRMTTDVTNVEMSYMMLIRVAIRAPLMLTFSMVMAFSINWRMALIFLGTTPILITGLAFIMKKAIPFFNRIFHKYDALNESVEENIRGMRVVKSYNREDFEKEKFGKASENVKNEFTKAEKLVALNTPLMNFCIYAGLIAIFTVASVLIIKSNEALMQLTQIQSFMAYSFQILMSLMMLSMILVMIFMSMASAKRIAEVLNEKVTIVSPKAAVFEVKDGSIEFENVCFKYSENAEKHALSDINLKIESGQTVGIIGSTGSSKTSLVQLIPRLYDTSEGSVKVGGIDVREYDLETLRNTVGMVLQKNVLFSGTLEENIRWGDNEASEEEVLKALELAQIPNFPLDKRIEQGGSNVSGGQKQRLCIARALLKKPKILILDDSTSAVDTKTDSLIRQAFKEYIPSTTKIIIAQRIASVQDADKIIIMDGGKIQDVGTHEKLLESNEIYKELYYSQNRVNGNEQLTGGDING